MSPRTETSYKAERPGEVAPHTEAQGSGRTVDDGVVQLQFAFLSGETCRAERSAEAESAASGDGRRDAAGVSRGHSTADASAERPEQEGRERPRATSAAAAKPNGGADDRRRTESSDPHDDLLEQILSRENMLRAWQRVKANRGAAGVDEMSIDDFPAWARQHWDRTRSLLRKGAYRPSPVRRTEIPKRTGGTRPLGIPTVLDRVIQQAIAQVLTPTFEAIFSEYSYGFRPGRSAHDAVCYVSKTQRAGYEVAVDADLSKFFDRVNHDVLMRLVAQHVDDRRVLRLIGRYLRAGVSIDGVVDPTDKGVPQGGPLSPLLANVVLHELDCELERRGHRFARYADDFIILVKSKRAAERVFDGIRRFLKRQLRLEVNETKSRIAPVGQCDFLGFSFTRKRIRWSNAAEREFKRRVRRLTSRSWGVSMEYRLKKLAEYLRGWIGYFGLSEVYRPLPELDHWIRRRVRLCYWKMWKKPRRRMRALIKLGTHPRTAILTGRSRKGHWHLSRTLATQTGMTNAWLAAQGLPSLKDQWVAIHYPPRAGKPS